MKSFLTRLASGAVLLAIILATGFVGGPVLFAFTLIISLIGYWEFLKVFGLEKKLPGILGILFAILYYGCLILGVGGNLVLIGLLMALMAVYVFTFPKYKTEEIMTSLFGFVYVVMMLSFLYQTRMLPVDGKETSIVYWLIFICSWGCDTCAYCVGMLIGKHKMAPKLSPKKSVEGAVGGIVGAGLLGFLFGTVFKAQLPLTDPALGCMIICMVGGAISQIGDLAASAIKRNHEIKDYGTLIPGHGGILDRFDSVIFVAPAIYYTVLLLQQGIGFFR